MDGDVSIAVDGEGELRASGKCQIAEIGKILSLHGQREPGPIGGPDGSYYECSSFMALSPARYILFWQIT